jgi:sugar lactone lactonase YvrE
MRRIRSWGVPEHASCLTAGPDGRVYIGSAGRVDAYDLDGNHVGGFTAGEQDKPADVTALAVFGVDILVADAQARIIRRYDLVGKPRGVIGDQSKTRSFILPNRSLDLAVDSRGLVYATDSGRHQVTAWDLDGAPRGKFGKFGMMAPEDFVGCCNPVNVAVTPDGKVVTAEKMVARVKVFEPDGRLLALIGPEHFDPACTHIHLAVDSRGRILAADPVRREVKVFSPNQAPGKGASR